MKQIQVLTYTEKHSRFLIYTYEVSSCEDGKKAFAEVKSLNPKADHVLRASRTQNNFGVYVEESSEDKEPISSMRKTAGLLVKKDIRDKAVFVVRYFGGTKFGASHLDQVYFRLALQGLKSKAF